MKKNRTIFLGVAAGAMALAVGAFALSANSGALAIFAEPVSTPTHTIVLDGDNMSLGTLEDGYQYMSFHGEKAIGDLYDLDTYEDAENDYENYLWYDSATVSFGEDGKIASFVSAAHEMFCVYFCLEERAVVDFDKSVLNMTINDDYDYIKIEEDDSVYVPSGYRIYYFFTGFWGHYSEVVTIDSIKIVFHC